MTAKVLTFFNNKGGVGKTSLIYHLAWMMSELGHTVLACDFDPQANLTAAFLEEKELEGLWPEIEDDAANTIYKCVKPLTEVGDLQQPELKKITNNLYLLPGDLGLSGFEDRLSMEWPVTLGGRDLFRPFRIITAFWQIAQLGAAEIKADWVLVDVGPNLGAINRSVLIGTDFVVIPLGADLFSLQGLRNLGPTLTEWRSEWKKRLGNYEKPGFSLPQGKMSPLGYIVQQHLVRLNRPILAYDKWVKRMPGEYRSSILDQKTASPPESPESDPLCIGTLRHYRSLVPLGQEARKPIFFLTPADGAIGAHASAVQSAREDFRKLTLSILEKAHLADNPLDV